MRLFFGVILVLALPGPVFSQSEGLARFREIRSNPKLQAQLASLVDISIRRAFGEEVPLPADLDEVFQEPLGVFVTAKRGEEVRGCMGSLQPRQASLAEEIAVNLKLAFFRDPRHRPVLREELSGMQIYLTTAGTPSPVTKLGSLSPARDAILLKAGGKEAVVLPGEARTLRYLLAFAKAKAGVKKKESFTVYRFPVEILNVTLKPRR
ncbi:MAG: AMMECR1 domain-containing protein [bacterium]